MKIIYEKGDRVFVLATGERGTIYEIGIGDELFIAGKPYYPDELRSALDVAFNNEYSDANTIGYDQNGDPVGTHSTGNEACPAVHGGVCPIKKHNTTLADDAAADHEDLRRHDALGLND